MSCENCNEKIRQLQQELDILKEKHQALARKENDWALAISNVVLRRVTSEAQKNIVMHSLDLHARIADVFKKALVLDEEFSSDADAEVVNVLDYILGVIPADHCGVLNRHADVAAN